MEWRESVWEKRWAENQLRWHKSEVNPFLMKHMEKITTRSQENPNPSEKEIRLKFFIPLCGKIVDIPYILSCGHSVFAVEGVKQAIEALNEEHSLNLLFNEEESLFSTDDGRLKIFCGNIFSCPVEKWGPFDIIWDRGSITAIEETSWISYRDFMKRAVIDAKGDICDFQYLLVVFEYDKSKSDGKGPRCVTGEDMSTLYGNWTTFTQVEKVPLHSQHVIRKMVGEDSPAFEILYLLTNKKL